MSVLDLVKHRKVLLAAHRGACGGNIPCNSLQAFQAAVLSGADIVELDVDMSEDGVLFIQHPGMEPVHLRMRESIRSHPASEVEKIRLSNCDHAPTQYRIPRLEEALTLLKGRCLINIDKFWEHPAEISALVHDLHMEEDVIIKTDCRPENLDMVERYAPDLPFMGLCRRGPEDLDALNGRSIRYIGAEVLFDREESALCSRAFLESMHRADKIVWVNAIVYYYEDVLSAGRNDDVSVSEDPEKGWGWLADRGFDIIQTDFVYQCRRFLEDTGRRSR